MAVKYFKPGTFHSLEEIEKVRFLIKLLPWVSGCTFWKLRPSSHLWMVRKWL